jgi:hypothetical protein
MTNLPTIHQTITRLPVPDYRLGTALKTLVRFSPSDPSRPVEMGRALTDAERGAITQRVADIDTLMAYRDPEAVRRAVAAMMLTIPSARANQTEAAAVVTSYVHALADVPAWAVSEAARRFARGEAVDHDPAFAPSAARMHQEAISATYELRFEKQSLERMLTGIVSPPLKVQTAEERKAIADRTTKTAASEGLRARAEALGLDPEKKTLSEIEDRGGTGTFRKLKGAA